MLFLGTIALAPLLSSSVIVVGASRLSDERPKGLGQFAVTHSTRQLHSLIHPTLREKLSDTALDYTEVISGVYLSESTSEGLLRSLNLHRGFTTSPNSNLQPSSRHNQVDASWALHRMTGVERISNLEPNPEGRDFEYVYDYDWLGHEAIAWIVDSGVDCSNRDFFYRAKCREKSAHNALRLPYDVNGHGTAVASAFGANRYGIARRSVIRPVRMYNARMEADILDFIKISQQLRKSINRATQSRPSISHLVLFPSSASRNDALDLSFLYLDRAGIMCVTTASNQPVDACTLSPANLDFVVTVGATNVDDHLLEGTGYGRCVDILAPGDRVRVSGWHAPDPVQDRHPRPPAIYSGSSIASAFVAGYIATWLQPIKHLSLIPHPHRQASVATLVKTYLAVSSTTLKNQLIPIDPSTHQPQPPSTLNRFIIPLTRPQYSEGQSFGPKIDPMALRGQYTTTLTPHQSTASDPNPDFAGSSTGTTRAYSTMDMHMTYSIWVEGVMEQTTRSFVHVSERQPFAANADGEDGEEEGYRMTGARTLAMQSCEDLANFQRDVDRHLCALVTQALHQPPSPSPPSYLHLRPRPPHTFQQYHHFVPTSRAMHKKPRIHHQSPSPEPSIV
ncbi:hypothetical protein PYCC9005_005306 [Savitreella phatthalungensis]